MKYILNAIKQKSIYIPLENFSEAFDEFWNLLSCEFLKLETLQYYDVAGDPNFSAFINNDIDSYILALKQFYHDENSLPCNHLENKIDFKRLHLLERPFSSYIEYELYSYIISEKLGEDIRCTDKIKNITDNFSDFIMFDGKAILINNFNREGKWLGSWRYLSSSDDELLIALRKKYMEHFVMAKNFKEFAKYDKIIIERMNGFLKPTTKF